MRKHLNCGMLFSNFNEPARAGQKLVIEAGRIVYAGPASRAPEPAPGDISIDHSSQFVMPGLVDIHVHLAYGNAMTEEDIDLYASREYRALRGMVAAHRVLAAGITSMADPATTGLVSLAVRDAIDAGLFPGPRILSAGRQITARQGLSDWYPTWVGVPETSVGVLVDDGADGIREIRKQVKEGVDFIKIAMDGDVINPTTGLVSGFNQEEIGVMVQETHRLGRKVVVHARGAEGVKYAARAGVDVIFHASWMDDEGLDLVLEKGCALCPTLSMPMNNIEFSRPSDPAHLKAVDAHKREMASAFDVLTRARKAGATFMLGTDTGFAVTPYGEWYAKELEIYIKHLGFSAAEALHAATAVNARFMTQKAEIGVLETGRRADLLITDADPVADIGVMGERNSIKAVYLDGELVTPDRHEGARRLASETSYTLWNRVYTRDMVEGTAETSTKDGRWSANF